jgi:hypothetical protein
MLDTYRYRLSEFNIEFDLFILPIHVCHVPVPYDIVTVVTYM